MTEYRFHEEHLQRPVVAAGRREWRGVDKAGRAVNWNTVLSEG